MSLKRKLSDRGWGMLGLKHDIRDYDPNVEEWPIDTGSPGLLGTPWALADFWLVGLGDRAEVVIKWAESLNLDSIIRSASSAQRHYEAWLSNQIRHAGGAAATAYRALKLVLVPPDQHVDHGPAA